MFVPIQLNLCPLKSMIMRNTNFPVDNLIPHFDPLCPLPPPSSFSSYVNHTSTTIPNSNSGHFNHQPEYRQYQNQHQHQHHHHQHQQQCPPPQPMYINLNYHPPPPPPTNTSNAAAAQSQTLMMMTTNSCAGFNHVGGSGGGGPSDIMSVPLGHMEGGNMVIGTGNNLDENRPVSLDLHRFRRPTMFVAIIDCIFATSLLVFHGLTLMVQEIPVEAENWLLPRVPMTPGQLTITGYMEVIAWIGILSINFTQLLVAVTLFNGCDKSSEALKAFEASRLWIKTCIFLITILFTKLCILYFMYHMDMYAFGTIICTALETLFHAVGLVVVVKFFDEIKENNPLISTIYLTSDENDSPKRNNAVSDAVWF